MLDNATTTAPGAPAPIAPQQPERNDDDKRRSELVEADLLIEDVSIDGMCGVY